ncbi:MAG: hypothetical protein AAFW64_02200 [Pseudomonadota bacterium]
MQLAFIILGAMAGLTAFAVSIALGTGILPAALLLSCTATAATLIAMLHTAYNRTGFRL